ncbi:MAG: Protein of unknown function (DUF1194) [Rhodobacteraceae bacterium HLUCCA08]|nr:MAG: Protein of unknown function (DUF1194) [Rhodobacteraceae bacterium HLUCCA08]
MTRARALVAAALTALPAPGLAECRLALAIGMDVSSSVDAFEDALQRQGLAHALLADPVQEAFFDGPPVALAVFEWSGRYNQRLIVDWTLVDTPDALAAMSTRIAGSRRGTDDYPTALGHALAFGAMLLQEAPVCWQAKIDISGDGPNNEGYPAGSAYRAFPFDGVTVNGLAIVAEDGSGTLAHYRTEVIRGPDAFVEVARGFEDFQAAMERKLERELAAQVIGAQE